jgi:hypothetical protein
MIKIKIDDPIDAKLRLKAKKVINGDIVILDHPDIDVLISTDENRVVTYPKKEYADHVYAVQSRLFDYLTMKGACKHGSVKAANIFGSLQGTLLADKINQPAVDPVQIAIYLVTKFLKNELHFGDIVDDYQESYEEELSNPPDDETTELGKVPHEPRKGTNYYGGSSTGNSAGMGFGMFQENKER